MENLSPKVWGRYSADSPRGFAQLEGSLNLLYRFKHSRRAYGACQQLAIDNGEETTYQFNCNFSIFQLSYFALWLELDLSLLLTPKMPTAATAITINNKKNLPFIDRPPFCVHPIYKLYKNSKLGSNKKLGSQTLHLEISPK